MSAPAANTRSEFVTKAERICAVAGKQAEKLVRKLNNGKRVIEPDRNPQQAGKVILSTIPIARRAYRDIGLLSPAPGDEQEIARYLRHSNRATRLFAQGGRALLNEDLQRWDRLSGRAIGQYARAYYAVEGFGFKRCVS